MPAHIFDKLSEVLANFLKLTALFFISFENVLVAELFDKL